MAARSADLAGFLLSRFCSVVSNPCFRRFVALLSVLWRAFMKVFLCVRSKRALDVSHSPASSDLPLLKRKHPTGTNGTQWVADFSFRTSPEHQLDQLGVPAAKTIISLEHRKLNIFVFAEKPLHSLFLPRFN